MTRRAGSLKVVFIAVLVFFACSAAATGGQNSLLQERNLRDAFISDPPFSAPAADSAAAVPPAGTLPAQSPQAADPSSPVQPRSAFVPAPSTARPTEVPELLVRGYTVDPSGAVNLIGMDGVLRTIDGTSPVKLIFPPEYGLPPQIVGGTRPAAQPYQAAVPAQIAVRGYSIHPSGVIIILGMDGTIRTLDGSVPVTLIFPPEYALPPQTVGGTATPATGGQMQVYAPVAPGAQQPSGSTPAQVVVGGQSGSVGSSGGTEVQSSIGSEIPAAIIQEGVSAIFRQIQKGSKK